MRVRGSAAAATCNYNHHHGNSPCGVLLAVATLGAAVVVIMMMTRTVVAVTAFMTVPSHDNARSILHHGYPCGFVVHVNGDHCCSSGGHRTRSASSARRRRQRPQDLDTPIRQHHPRMRILTMSESNNNSDEPLPNMSFNNDNTAPPGKKTKNKTRKRVTTDVLVEANTPDASLSLQQEPQPPPSISVDGTEDVDAFNMAAATGTLEMQDASNGSFDGDNFDIYNTNNAPESVDSNPLNILSERRANENDETVDDGDVALLEVDASFVPPQSMPTVVMDDHIPETNLAGADVTFEMNQQDETTPRSQWSNDRADRNEEPESIATNNEDVSVLMPNEDPTKAVNPPTIPSLVMASNEDMSMRNDFNSNMELSPVQSIPSLPVDDTDEANAFEAELSLEMNSNGLPWNSTDNDVGINEQVSSGFSNEEISVPTENAWGASNVDVTRVGDSSSAPEMNDEPTTSWSGDNLGIGEPDYVGSNNEEMSSLADNVSETSGEDVAMDIDSTSAQSVPSWVDDVDEADVDVADNIASEMNSEPNMSLDQDVLYRFEKQSAAAAASSEISDEDVASNDSLLQTVDENEIETDGYAKGSSNNEWFQQRPTVIMTPEERAEQADGAWISMEVKAGVNADTIKGAAIAAFVLSTVSQNEVLVTIFGIVPIVSYLSITRGTTGQTVRKIGDLSWLWTSKVSETVLGDNDTLLADIQSTWVNVQKVTTQFWTQSALWLAEQNESLQNQKEVLRKKQIAGHAVAKAEQKVAQISYEYFIATSEQVQENDMQKLQRLLNEAEEECIAAADRNLDRQKVKEATQRSILTRRLEFERRASIQRLIDAEEYRRQEEVRLADEARIVAAEEARSMEESVKKEAMRLRELERAAETARLSQERWVVTQRVVEAKQRSLLETRLLIDRIAMSRLKEASRLRDLASAAEQARMDESNRLAEEAILEGEARLSQERWVVTQRVAEAKQRSLLEFRLLNDRIKIIRLKEESQAARIEEENRLAEETRLTEQARMEEENRLAEETRLTEQAQMEEENRLAEETRLTEQARIEEENRLAEEARLTEAEEDEVLSVEQSMVDYERSLAEDLLSKLTGPIASDEPNLNDVKTAIERVGDDSDSTSSDKQWWE
jgi:hypothetical protein